LVRSSTILNDWPVRTSRKEPTKPGENQAGEGGVTEIHGWRAVATRPKSTKPLRAAAMSFRHLKFRQPVADPVRADL
jgi:hypothetical protein